VRHCSDSTTVTPALDRDELPVDSECLLFSRLPRPVEDVFEAFDDATDGNLAKLKRRCKNGFLNVCDCGDVGDLVVDVAVSTERWGLGAIMWTFCP